MCSMRLENILRSNGIINKHLVMYYFVLLIEAEGTLFPLTRQQHDDMALSRYYCITHGPSINPFTRNLLSSTNHKF